MFSIFNDIFLIARFPTTRSNPITIDTASIQITAGAATIVERRLTPVFSVYNIFFSESNITKSYQEWEYF